VGETNIPVIILVLDPNTKEKIYHEHQVQITGVCIYKYIHIYIYIYIYIYKYNTPYTMK